MDNIIENSENQFANGQNSRDLRGSSDGEGPDTHVDAGDLDERTDSSDGLEALRPDSDEDLKRRIELSDGTPGDSRTSGGSPWFRRISKRVLVVVLLVLALGAVS